MVQAIPKWDMLVTWCQVTSFHQLLLGKSTIDKNAHRINDLDFVIGDDAHRMRTDAANWEFHRLLNKGQVESWEGIEKFWHKAIN